MRKWAWWGDLPLGFFFGFLAGALFFVLNEDGHHAASSALFAAWALMSVVGFAALWVNLIRDLRTLWRKVRNP